VREGEKLFEEIGCASCHVSTLKTGESEHKYLAKQTFHPYTDLLLHDMGEGLADNRRDFEANGREWRTAPLWGVGLTETILGGKGFYLHDGRARSLEEAILWHDGEAAASREKFESLSMESRERVIDFLYSL
jgi:CxxC motif-containing protein (DUF1111 family)